MVQPFKLSPSDLTFLWAECPRCFYLKAVYGLARPATPMPKMFTRIDRLMKAFFDGQPTVELSPALPPGVVRHGDRWVTSQPVVGPASTCFLKGRFDVAVEFDDGSYGIVDFKTSESRPEHVAFYSRQLHAYAYCLEHAQPGSLALAPVSRLGLLSVEPSRMERTELGYVAYLGKATWQECPKDEAGFLAFLGEVAAVLARPDPPPPAATCSFCQYRENARHNDW